MAKFDPQEAVGFDIEVETMPVSFRDHFIMPPFSVLDARDGGWQSRKKAWLSLGIKSELGRGENTLKFSKAASTEFREFQKSQMSHEEKAKQLLYGDLKSVEDIKGKHQQLSIEEKQKATLYKSQDRLNAIMAQRRTAAKGTAPPKNNKMSGTSIFDPVLCEIAYSWFCPPGGEVLDPFAGGSVRGIVAAALGFHYTGIELRGEQVEANRVQWEEMKDKPWLKGKPMPVWVQGDSMNVRQLVQGKQFDMIFSCPPYGDLEVYSKDPADISNMTYDQFVEFYEKIIKRSCSLLKPNRLAAWVIGDFRDKKTGMLRGFIDDTNWAFSQAGLGLYNDAVLITMVGSLPIRAGAHFRNYRKLGRTHQVMQVYYKGKNCSELKGLFEEPTPDDVEDLGPVLNEINGVGEGPDFEESLSSDDGIPF